MGRYSSLWPRQSARGGGNQAALAANFSAVGLFNNSTADKLIVIRDFNFLFITGFGSHIAAQGKQGLNVAASTTGAMVTGDTTPFGQILTGTAAALPGTPDYYSFTNWPHDVPFIVLQPGWSSVFWSSVVNGQVVVGFVWDVIDVADLSTLREKFEDQA